MLSFLGLFFIIEHIRVFKSFCIDERSRASFLGKQKVDFLITISHVKFCKARKLYYIG